MLLLLLLLLLLHLGAFWELIADVGITISDILLTETKFALI
jgi:hypothetical protein